MTDAQASLLGSDAFVLVRVRYGNTVEMPLHAPQNLLASTFHPEDLYSLRTVLAPQTRFWARPVTRCACPYRSASSPCCQAWIALLSDDNINETSLETRFASGLPNVRMLFFQRSRSSHNVKFAFQRFLPLISVHLGSL
jgi:hypothetical protein